MPPRHTESTTERLRGSRDEEARARTSRRTEGSLRSHIAAGGLLMPLPIASIQIRHGAAGEAYYRARRNMGDTHSEANVGWNAGSSAACSDTCNPE